MTINPREFRSALGCFPTGVALITANRPDRPIGITVNSFTPVSLDPPLVMWCLRKESDRFETFTQAKYFVINVLGTSHRDISSRLAKQGEHHLDGVALVPTSLGPPGLADALAIFECESEALYNVGDHVILIGRVVKFTRQEAGIPLVYFRGNYSVLSDDL